MAPNTEHDALISSYEHLPTMPRAADALHTIRKIASLVKPIMRKHGWRVRILSEFYPDDQRLLGMFICMPECKNLTITSRNQRQPRSQDLPQVTLSQR